MNLCYECSADKRYCGHESDKCIHCKPHMPCVGCINEAKEKLLHGCDGPITDFVIISRGCHLQTTEKYSGKNGADIISNAIAEALQEYGYLKTDNPVYSTGS